MSTIEESIEVDVPVRRGKLMLQLDVEPEGFVESAGDLERFKDLIEAQGVESGAWRGDVGQKG